MHRGQSLGRDRRRTLSCGWRGLSNADPERPGRSRSEISTEVFSAEEVSAATISCDLCLVTFVPGLDPETSHRDAGSLPACFGAPNVATIRRAHGKELGAPRPRRSPCQKPVVYHLALRCLMVQPWCVSRFYGQLSMLQARIERAGVILASAGPSTGKCEASVVRVRYEGPLDPNYISRLRVLLGLIVVTGLAVCLGGGMRRLAGTRKSSTQPLHHRHDQPLPAAQDFADPARGAEDRHHVGVREAVLVHNRLIVITLQREGRRDRAALRAIAGVAARALLLVLACSLISVASHSSQPKGSRPSISSNSIQNQGRPAYSGASHARRPPCGRAVEPMTSPLRTKTRRARLTLARCAAPTTTLP